MGQSTHAAAHLHAGVRGYDDLAAVVHDVKGVRRGARQHPHEAARVGGPGPRKPDHLARQEGIEQGRAINVHGSKHQNWLSRTVSRKATTRQAKAVLKPKGFTAKDKVAKNSSTMAKPLSWSRTFNSCKAAEGEVALKTGF